MPVTGIADTFGAGSWELQVSKDSQRRRVESEIIHVDFEV